jgi:hypothetical protein
MIWGKRKFTHADYSPYFAKMEKLVQITPALYREFMMVSTKTADAGINQVYVGVPSEAFISGFDGFERVEEASLPKLIDTVHIADTRMNEFKSRFQFRGEGLR